jgi:hypothetical protein
MIASGGNWTLFASALLREVHRPFIAEEVDGNK